MSTNMLGIDSEALRKLWCGPLSDLIIKLTGKNGPEVEKDLARFLRKQEEKEKGRLNQGWPVFHMSPQFEAQPYVDFDKRHSWSCESTKGNGAVARLELSRVRLIPPSYQILSKKHHIQMRSSSWRCLDGQAFSACWLEREQLPLHWQVMGTIYFDGCVIYPTAATKAERPKKEYVFGMDYIHGRGWSYDIYPLDRSYRFTHKDCSAVLV